MQPTSKRGLGWKVAFVIAAVAIGGLVSAIPAEAAGGSKVVESSDTYVKSQCRFTVQGLHVVNDTNTFVRYRLTAQASARFSTGYKVAYVRAKCEVFDNNLVSASLNPSANRRHVYASEIFDVEYVPPYTVCSSAEYVLKDGTFGVTPVVCG